MKPQLDQLAQKLQPLIRTLHRFMGIIVIAAFSAMAGYIMMQVSSVDRAEPDANTVTELIRESASPKIDSKAAKKISDLEEQHIELKSLFQQARENPFEE